MDNKKNIDWDKIEIDYRAGLKTLRVIAEEHGITHGAIRKRAARDEWDRDLSAKIRAKAEALVSKAQVPSSVSKASENEIISICAASQASIIISHRKDISKSREIGIKLFRELELQTDNIELYEQLGELMCDPESNRTSLNNLYQKILSTPGRTDTYRKLTESLKTMIGLERQAFGLADNANGEANQSPSEPGLDPADAYKRMVNVD